jgi:hypothetical protein
MIRSVLASSWLPLLYWGAAVVAMICWVRHEPLKQRPGHQEIEKVATASVPTSPPRQDWASTTHAHPVNDPIADVHIPIGFWSPQSFVLEPLNSAALRRMTAAATKQTPISMEARTPPGARATMLSIRADPPEQATPTTLAIHCRTSVAISNAHGRVVTIEGVVTQEVVSSSGKILIMAGSKVVGSGLLDSDNGRFKSDGLWSIFFDGTELKVRAQLLDRLAGLPGLSGQEELNEDGALQREAIARDGRPILVPGGAPFVLEVHGDIQLQEKQR